MAVRNIEFSFKQFKILSLIFLNCFVLHQLPAQTGSQKPNFIFYLADDQDKLDYGAYGNDKVMTPSIDKLASEGMRFNRAYTGQAICAPSRSQLYTGMYPLKNGCFVNHISSFENTKSITEYLSEAGYDVILAGKSHVGPPNVYNWSISMGEEEIAGIEPNSEVPLTKIKEYISTSSKPFCMFVTSHYPHGPFPDNSPYTADDVIIHPYMNGDGSGRTGYYYAIEMGNKEFGELINFVDTVSAIDNTVFIYSADHGYAGKFTASEPGLNVPFIVRWKDMIEPGSQTDALISYVDVMPTFLDIAGEPIPEGIDGKSFLKVLTGETTSSNDYVYGVVTNQNVQTPEIFPARAVIGKKYKYIRNTNSIEVYEQNFGTDENLNKFIEIGAKNHPNIPYEELYDLETDPYEKVNLAKEAAYETIKNEFSAKLDQWMEEQNDFLRYYPAPLIQSPNYQLDKTTKYYAPPAELEGALSDSEVLPLVYTEPSPPKALRVYQETPTSVRLYWTPAFYSADVTGYDIFQDDTWIKTVEETNAEIAGLTEGAEYSFTVSARNDLGNVSSSSNKVTINGPSVQDPIELLENGDFESGYNTNWNHQANGESVVNYSEVTEDLITNSTKASKAEVVKLGEKGYYTSSINLTKFEVETGKEYTVSFYAKKGSEANANVKLVFQSPGIFRSEDFSLSTEWKQYNHVFTADEQVDDKQIKIWYLDEGNTYFIDNVSCKTVSEDANSPATFDLSETDQTVDGFGHGMKRGTKDLYTLSNSTIRQNVIDLVYKELDVNMTRFFVYSDLEMENDNNDPFAAFPGGFDWTRYEDSAPVNAWKCQYVATALKDAMEASNVGFDYLIGNCNSAPPFIKTDGQISGKGGNLVPGGEDEFSEFLIEFLKGMKSRYNIDVTHISPFNEPDWDVDYENMIPTPEQTIPIINNLQQRLTAESLSNVKIVAPESYRVHSPDNENKGTTNYISEIFSNSEARQAVDVVGTHTYADQDNTADWGALKDVSADKPVWVTESSTLEDPDLTMTNASIIIKWIIRGFNEGGLKAYMYHLGYSQGEGALIKYSENGVILPKRYYAFKQFSNFVKPGYKRLTADFNRSNIWGTGFVSPNSNQVVIELLNEGDVMEYPISLPADVYNVKHFVTSDSGTENCSLADDIEFSPDSSSMNVYLGQKSFHTIVINIGSANSTIKKESPVNSLLVYPNPANDYLTISIPRHAAEGQLMIYNIIGEKVREYPISKDQRLYKLDISSLNHGVYVVIINSKKPHITKFIKN